MSADVNFICKIDRELYRVVEQELLTEEVIITEEQILHIEEGHPGDYGRLSAYISQVLQEPDYILRGNRPHTALVLKEISTPDMAAEIILRLKVSSDPEEYKTLLSRCGASARNASAVFCVRVRYFTKRDKCGILNIG